MKKLLVLGAMEMHVPLIKRAKEMGVYVITVDYIPDNPGHKLADEAYFDSTTDFEAVLSCGKKTIAFYSCGDYKSYVDDQVEKYKEYDILITAYNKKFATIGWVWLANSEIIEKVEKYQANDADNMKALNDILSRI